ncbi:hypothetical protein IWX49DRAFT_584270 [Phyllosticta citricarpa]|uniref:Secreted protein n=1 Tax=Phyllosticta citricarpa TaxID=55181 RepID=A0ABR1LFV3_9PEZI
MTTGFIIIVIIILRHVRSSNYAFDWALPLCRSGSARDASARDVDACASTASGRSPVLPRHKFIARPISKPSLPRLRTWWTHLGALTLHQTNSVVMSTAEPRLLYLAY